MQKNKEKLENIIKQAKKMLEEIKQHYEDEQTIYFSLLQELNSDKYTKVVSKNLFKISIKDQIPILQLLVLYKEKAKELCEKYDFDIEED